MKHIWSRKEAILKLNQNLKLALLNVNSDFSLQVYVGTTNVQNLQVSFNMHIIWHSCSSVMLLNTK